MESLQAALLILHIIIALLIIVLVLLQPSGGGDGLVSSYNPGSNFMNIRAAANFLTRTTMILAFIFMLNTLFLGVIAKKMSVSKSIINEIYEKEKVKQSVPLAE